MSHRIRIVQGDITELKVDAIVNAANEGLLGGGGVDGAIHQAAGPELLQECIALKGCATGDAKVTGGYNLNASHVIHTVGPIWKGGVAGEPQLLRGCYRTCFKLASKLGLKSLAFPAFLVFPAPSSGVFGYPMRKVAHIALKESLEFLKQSQFMEEVVHVCFTEEVYQVFQEIFKELTLQSSLGPIFTEAQLSNIYSELLELDEFDHIDFSDIDLEKIDNFLASAPVNAFLPVPDPLYKKSLPPVNSQGEMEYQVGDKSLIVPKTYVALVEFSFRRFGGQPGLVTLPDSNIFALLWNYIQQVVNWAFTLERTLYGQVYETLKAVDQFHEQMQIDLRALEQDYGKDSLYQSLEILPDLFVFLCKLLAADGISKKFKSEMSLALIYLVSPIDFIPEGIITHPVAFADDMAIILFVLKRGKQSKDLNQKMMQRLWPGDLAQVQSLDLRLEEMENLLGQDFIESIWDYLHQRASKI
jgi:O-acetyl-ADP-ribose deacetylase